jgi:hypothetical protein
MSSWRQYPIVFNIKYTKPIDQSIQACSLLQFDDASFPAALICSGETDCLLLMLPAEERCGSFVVIPVFRDKCNYAISRIMLGIRGGSTGRRESTSAGSAIRSDPLASGCWVFRVCPRDK